MSAQHLYVLFPAARCEGLCPPRPVLVQRAELDSGQVGVWSSDGVETKFPLKNWSFLPSSGATEIDDIGSTAHNSGYTKGQWSATKSLEGGYAHKLKLTDSKHARADVFEYSTWGMRVISTHDVVTVSVFDVMAIMAVVAAVAGALMLIRRRKRSNAAL